MYDAALQSYTEHIHSSIITIICLGCSILLYQQPALGASDAISSYINKGFSLVVERSFYTRSAWVRFPYSLADPAGCIYTPNGH
jgi:hypothetical protein